MAMTAMTQTSYEAFVELAQRGTFVPVCKEIIADLLTPVSAFLKIAEHSDYAFLLESVEGAEHVARYSFLGKDPFLVLRAQDGKTVLERAGVITEQSGPFMSTLRTLMADFHSPFVPGLPRFTGGAVGYLSYEAARWFEPALQRAWDRPLTPTADGDDDAGFMLFDTVLAFDHVRHRILIIANARVTADDNLEALYQFACAKIQFLERELERSLSEPEVGRPAAVEVRSNTTRDAFERGRRHLSSGGVATLRSHCDGRSLHGVPRAAVRESLALHVLHPHRDSIDRWIVTGDVGPCRGAAGGNSSDCWYATAGPHRGRGYPARRGAERQREGSGGACNARRSRPERLGPGL